MTRLPFRTIAAAAIVAVVLVIFAVTYVAVRATSRPAPSHVASLGTPAGRARATLDVTSGMPVLSVRVADLGGTLLRVATPDDAPVRPVLGGSGAAPVRLSLAPAQEDEGQASNSPGNESSEGESDGEGDGDRDSAYTVSVVLNSSVTWNLQLAGGTSKTVADLRGGRVAGINVTAGSDIIDIALPDPARGPSDARSVPLRLAGGASQFLVTVPAAVPVRLRLGGGAAEVTAGDRSWTGVAGGTLITPPGWADAAARYDIDATAGVSRLTIRAQ